MSVPELGPALDSYAQAMRIVREHHQAPVKDKTYRATTLGQEVAHFMRSFRAYSDSASSYRDYESILAKFALYYPDRDLASFEPPTGTVDLVEFLDYQWGEASPRTRKKARSVLKSFFTWGQGVYKINGNPVIAIRPPKVRDVERELFAPQVVTAIIDSQDDLRDRIAVKLLLMLGIRKGTLTKLQLEDFDLARRKVILRSKGGKIRNLPLPTEELREEIETLVTTPGVSRREYLLHPRKRGPAWKPGQDSSRDTPDIGVIWSDPLRPLSTSAMHRWWYRCLYRAGVVEKGQTSGAKMHRARYTAGTEFYRRTLDTQGTQRLLGHADIGTTMDSYVVPSETDLSDKLEMMWAADNDA